ncbi:MAG TPA: multicopper oxidase domain-containing protein [Anaeromyxobacteraceae bacterium]|nr:multicopper oxidase domain-containing protein [Anaeromyxobacteraceae bacterium]
MKKVAALFVMLLSVDVLAQPIPGGSLDPTSVPKYQEALTVPPLMPSESANTYSIAAKPRVQQVLPAGYPATNVFAYGATNTATSFSWPAFTIEAQQKAPVTVTWVNQLVDASNKFVPHLFTVDPTLHWANPPGPVDTRPTFKVTPPPYKGPVPLVTHLHGAHVDPESDGYPEAWWLPAAANIKDCQVVNSAGCFYTKGSNYGNAPNSPPQPNGQATFKYRNDQRASTLWFHDHALGMTRVNVYAGLAGFYLLRDNYEKGLKLPGPYGKYEIPLAIQDRSFNTNGSLFYPDSRVFFDGFPGPYIPGSDIAPYLNPEFFGNFMTVNGKTWPKLAVEKRKYRFRVLNGSDSRWLILQFANRSLAPNGLKFNVIGTEGGLITGKPLALDQLRVAPGERYDVIVDFSGFAVGTRIVMINVGPDEPFSGHQETQVPADPGTTGQVMAFDVVKLTAPDTSVLPAALNPPSDGFEPKAVTKKRTVTLTEFDSAVICLSDGSPSATFILCGDPNFPDQQPFGPSEAQIGNAFGPLPWMAPVSENVKQFATEQWTIVNRTADAHPIHLHQTQFKVVWRAPIDQPAYDAALAACNPTATMMMETDAGLRPSCPPNPDAFINGPIEQPLDAEKFGQKDTLQTNPGWITKLNAYFDIPGLYVWHCHILSHEDNEMMRPICVSPDPTRPVCKP